MKKLTAKDFKPGRTLTLHGEYQVDAAIRIPKGDPVTIDGNYHLYFKGNGGKVGAARMFIFNVGPGTTLNLKPGGYFDFPEKCGIAKVFDDRKKHDRKTAGRFYSEGTWQRRGNLVHCQGMAEVICKRFISDGTPNKYFACAFGVNDKATKSNGTFILDNRGLDTVIKGGKYEGIIRTMQCAFVQLLGVKTKGQTKQDVQLRSGDYAEIRDCQFRNCAIGFIEDADIPNVDPLDRVDINRSKTGPIDWGNGQTGKVYRDGKRIK